MSRAPRLITALLAVALSQAATAAEDEPLRLLIDQGRYWQERGDHVRAKEAWEKLLRANPQHPEALYGMAMTGLAAKEPGTVQRYLVELRNTSPDSPYLAQIEQAIALQRPGAEQAVETARAAARAGEPEKALAQYQQALDGKAPQGALALEYYQTLAATDEGWAQARAGLEKLALQNPGDAPTLLALAKVLSYREATRPQAIEQLAVLSRNPTVAEAATRDWRQALLWYGQSPGPGQVPLLQAYLQSHPDDTEIRERLERAQSAVQAQRAPTNPLVSRARAAFNELEAGRIEAAEREFEDMLRSAPNSVDALGGLGVVRLRQQRFAEARDLLQRASRQGAASRWRQALSSATYWANLNEATQARAAGDLARARTLLTEAVKLNPNESAGQNALGAVLAAAGELDAARNTYQQVLKRHPNDIDATRGLIGILGELGEAEQALQLIAALPPEQQGQINDIGRLRAAEAQGRARAAVARGDDAAAAAALQEALLHDPADPWSRLDLARLYLKVGAFEEARGVVDGLLSSNPDMPDALYASALLAAEMRDWNGALARLDRIAPPDRTPDMGRLQQRAWVHAQAAYASSLAKQRQPAQAMAILAQVAPYAGEDPELLGAVASAYAEAGDSNRALGMVRQLLARSGNPPDVGLLLQYAGILLATAQDVELASILRQLQTAEFDRRELNTYLDIRHAYILRQAEILRQRGQLADAYDMLSPALAERPDDPQAVGTLARLYADSGDPKQALEIYKRLLAYRPGDQQALVGAAGMAAAAGEYRYAQDAIEKALARDPNNPELLATAANIYRAQGRNSKAEEVLKRAVAIQGGPTQSTAGTYAPGGVQTRPANGNPFRNRVPTTARMPQVAYASAQLPAGAQLSRPYIPAPVAGNVIPPQGAMAYPPPGAWGQGQPGTPYPAPVQQPPMQYAQPAPQYAPPPQYYAPAPQQYAPAPQHYAPAPAPQYAPQPYPQPTYAPPPQQGQMQHYAPAPQYAPPQYAPQQYAPQPYAPAQQPYAPMPAQGNPWVPPGTPWQQAQPLPPGPPSLEQQLADVRAERSPDVTMGVNVRARDGEGGMSQVTDVQVPLEARLPVADGKFSLRVTPVTLGTDGVGRDFDTNSRFGGGPAAALAQSDGAVGGAGSQSASGVGVSVAYTGRNLSADIGTTPYGFRQVNVVGGARLAGDIGDSGFNYAVEVSRRAVTDSILSFAGARDARTGQSWGGVTATGGRVQLGLDTDTFGVYGYGGWHHLAGRNVASNQRIEGGFGVYTKLINEPDRELTAGLAFTGITYDKNLRHYTYGHGGYFSPQRFFSASLPVNWTHRTGRLSYYMRGSIGLQNFREDAALYFPTDSGLQSSAQSAMAAAYAAGLTTNTQAIYPGQSKTGLGYNFATAAEYQLAPQLYMGGTLSLDNASDYEQYAGGVYLRYLFNPSSRPPAMPVSPFSSPYNK